MKTLYFFGFVIGVLLFVSCSSDSNTKRYNLTTTATPAEGGTITPNSGEFEDRDVVELSASSNEHWVFDGWQGDLSGDSNPQTITMDSDKSVAALFVKRDYPLTITIQGAGTVTEQVIQPKATDYPHGTVVELTAEPAEGSEFEGWQGDIETTENPTTVTIEEQTEITAVFSGVEYPLEVTVEGEGTVSEEVVQSKTDYPEGTLVELTAEAADNWIFSVWSGDLEGDENPSQLTLDGPKEVTATFLRTYNLTTIADPEEGGSITPEAGQYIRDTTLEVEAVPSDGWEFVEWEGDFSGSVNPFDLTMNGDKTITATFERKEFELNTTVEGEGEIARTLLSGEETEGDTYLFESEVRLTAIADDGWNFLRWEGDASGDDPTIEVEMDEDKEITAVFIEFEGGDGSESNPYQVATLEQLDKVRNYLVSHFIQIADIDASETQAKSNGEGWFPIGDEEDGFSGSYNGDGFDITNLFIKRTSGLIGVWGVINEDAIISQVSLESMTVIYENTKEDNLLVAALAIRNYGKIINSQVDVIFEEQLTNGGGRQGRFSGFIAENYGLIENSRSDVSVIEVGNVYGFITSNYGSIDNSIATVIGIGESNITIERNVSGFVRDNQGTIIDSIVEELDVYSLLGGAGFGIVNRGIVSNSKSNIERFLTYRGSPAGFFLSNDNSGIIESSHSEGKIGIVDASCGSPDFEEERGMAAGFVLINLGLISESSSSINTSGICYPGAFVAKNHGTIEYSFSVGNVSAHPDYGSAAGFVAINFQTGQIRNTYTESEIFDENEPAGYVLENYGTIKNSYVAVPAYDPDHIPFEVAGFAFINDGEISSSYWDKELVNVNTAVIQGDDIGINGLTTSEMTGSNAQDNMPEFDWVDTWRLTSEYPILYWQNEE